LSAEAQLKNRLSVTHWGLEGAERSKPAVGMAGSGVPVGREGRDPAGSLPGVLGGPAPVLLLS